MTGERFARISERAIRCRDLSAVDWRVLACIALHADVTGRAYPSMATIAEITGIRRQDVPRVIRRLEHLIGLRRERGIGRGNRNVYVLRPEKPAANVRTAAGNSAANVRTAADRNVRTEATEMSAHRRREHTKEQTNKHICPDLDESADWFETFWRYYPSRKPHDNPKKPARLKFEAAVKRGVDPTMIVRGAENFAVYAAAHISGPRFIKTAEVWLNKECWSDYQQPPEPEPLRAGMI